MRAARTSWRDWARRAAWMSSEGVTRRSGSGSGSAAAAGGAGAGAGAETLGEGVGLGVMRLMLEIEKSVGRGLVAREAGELWLN